MAFVTRVVIEGAGDSTDEIRSVFDETQEAILVSLLRVPADGPRVTAEVYDRVKSDGHAVDWYKGRRVVWFVEPGGANDPDAGR